MLGAEGIRGIMIGVVIVTHGRLAHEFRAALEHVVGPQEQLETISIGPDDDLDIRRADMLAALARVDTGKGVIVLTDMFGGTPSNLAISAMERDNVEVIAGVNPVEAQEMVTLILRIRDERKVSIIMTEHVMAAVMRLCERVAVLDAGQLIASGTPQEIVQHPEVIAAYLGKKHA